MNMIIAMALALCLYAPAAMGAPLNEEDAINLECLRQAYPQVADLVPDGLGQTWLTLKDGARILYSDESASLQPGQLGGNIKQSMKHIYPLEPDRPHASCGFSPGRIRPYALYEALYGADAAAVQKNLAQVRFQGKVFRLARNAAAAFAKAAPTLAEAAASDPKNRAWLLPEGGYYWRKIAGEDHLSPHSYGIALDVGVKKAPYWRWSRQMPHPLQAVYPTAIVAPLEEQGFIWGGKWHEYDLMHFEYRPELICKARMYQKLKKKP